ncbi:uncharacterized protein LOC135837504 [Planococcus citri]|uniref:uncharacterized protein LOC135837504 n=1 Tax=Planococcus citri TaxID=170843 RepID=UPI0031F85380
MRSLKLSLAYRTMYNRSWIRLRLPLLPKITHPSCYQTGIYSTTPNIFHFYCTNALANTSHSTVSSQETDTNMKSEPCIDIAEIPNLTDNQLLEVISQLRDYYLTTFAPGELKRRARSPLVKAIDEECIHRGKRTWDLDKTIEVIDMFHPRGFYLCPNLLFWALKMKFMKAMKSPSPTMMKYISVIEKHKFWTKYNLKLYSLEFTLIKKLHHLTLPEISAVLHIMNLHRGKIVSRELLANIYDKLMEGIDQLDSHVLSTFLKFFSHQSIDGIDFTRLVDHLLVRLPSSNASLAGSAASFCCRHKIDNPLVLDQLAAYLSNRLPNINIVELETIVQTLVFFNYNSPNIYQQVIDNFEVEPLRSNVIEHPKRLSKILGNLCLIEIYPFQYVDRVLSKEFLHETFGKKLNYHNVLREIMILDGCVKAEFPHYEGNKLDESLEENLYCRSSSHIHHYLQTEGDTVIPGKSIAHDEFHYQPTSHNKTILDARRILKSIFTGGDCDSESEYVHTCYVLPFLPRPDLLFCLDREKRAAVKLGDEILNSIRVDYRKLRDECVDWYVVMSIGLHSDIVEDGNVVIYGKDIAKERILSKLGFKLIKIVPEIWFGWSEERRRDYLRETMS